jgi:hypothetical protein
MAGENYKKGQESDQQVSTREKGSDAAPAPIPTHARHIGPRQYDIGISAGWLGGPPARGSYKGSASGDSRQQGALEIDLFRPFSDAAGKWKLELYDKGPDGKTLLATFEGTTKHQGYDLKVTSFTPKNTDLPEGQRCLLPVFFSRIFHAPGEGMGGKVDFQQLFDESTVYYVPLKAHQDYANESWYIVLKCSIDDGSVHEDEDDLVHVYVKWPRGAVAYPMLGAPALVGSSDKWLELLVALERPLGEGAERFLIKSMLRIFPWGNKSARQDAIKKRTFKLADPDDRIDFRRHAFTDIGTDAKDVKGAPETGDGFRLRLGQMEHASLAGPSFAFRAAGSGAPIISPHGDEPQRATSPITIPMLYEIKRREADPKDPKKVPPGSVGEPLELKAKLARDVILYKVRVKLEDQGVGLYDLVWMTEDDFKLANAVVKLGLKDEIRPEQDQRLRDALHVMSRATRRDAAVNARTPYKHDGPKQDGSDWKPTRNKLATREEMFEILQSHHPVYLLDDGGSFRLGHLTDIHLDARLDIMSQNPLKLIPEGELATPPLGSLVNNYNATFTALANAILPDVDALVLTGDLIDYNRGFAHGAEGAIDEQFVWGLGLSAHELTSKYKHERNWILFFQVLKRLYNKHKKPIFTTLGNHDYRPNPYSVHPGFATPWSSYSFYPTVGGDLNLTLLELSACYGPKFATWTRQGTELRAEVASIETDPTSVQWYNYAINGWLDYSASVGSVSLLMMDWDCEESLIDLGKGSMLPRAKYFMTDTQRGIYARFREGKAPCKVLCCHPTLACNSAAIKISNAKAREGQALDDMNHGTMGKRSAGGSDAYGVGEVREMLASDVAWGKLSLVLTGHSHMDGIYAPMTNGKRVTMTHPINPSWGKEMEFPSDVTNRIIVTNSGGPLGEFTDKWWTRRSRPAGSVFTLASGSIKMRHVESKREQAEPRRCVHDSERRRVVDGEFSIGARVRDHVHGVIRSTPVMPDGYFRYIRDPDEPERPELNAIVALALVVHRGDGHWHKEISPLSRRKTEKIDDPNGTGQVECVEYGYQFSGLHVDRALEAAPLHGRLDQHEVYMVLIYDWKPRQSWVIRVRAHIHRAFGMTNAMDAAYEPLWFVDEHFPPFNQGSPRWAWKGK